MGMEAGQSWAIPGPGNHKYVWLFAREGSLSLTPPEFTKSLLSGQSPAANTFILPSYSKCHAVLIHTWHAPF